MENILRTEDGSLCADNNWLTFIKTNYFGENYANFAGRASRKEFWACSFLMLIVKAGTTTFLDNLAGLLFYYYCLISYFTLTARRCHDINLSFKWITYPLFALFVLRFPMIFVSLTLVDDFLRVYDLIYPVLPDSGIFYLIVLLFFKGNIDDNEYGNSVY